MSAVRPTTVCVCPPIPDRRFDWCAYFDPEPGNPCGWGTTEAEAITDLLVWVEEAA